MDPTIVDTAKQIADTDPTIALLARIFGNPLGILTGPTDGPLIDIIRSINVMIMSVSALFFCWGMVKLIIKGGHTGQALKETADVWFPIRATVGAALIAPVWNGYCLAQILMIQCMSWGVALANICYTAGLTGARQAISTSISAPQLPSPEVTAKQLLEAARLGAANDQIGVQMGSLGIARRTMTLNIASDATGVSITYDYGGIPEGGGARIAWPPVPPGVTPAVVEQMRAIQIDELKKLAVSIDAIAKHSVVGYANTMPTEPPADGGAWGSDAHIDAQPTVQDVRDYIAAAKAYRDATEQRWGELLKGAEIVQFSTRAGHVASWLDAGFIPARVAQAATAVHAVPASSTKIEPIPNGNVTPGDYSQMTDDEQIDAAMAAGLSGQPTPYDHAPGATVWQSFKNGLQGVADAPDRFKKWLRETVDSLVGGGIVKALGEGQGGIAGLASFGSRLVEAAGGAMLTWAGLAAAGSAIPVIGQGVVGLVGAVSPMITFLLGAIMAEGMLLATWLPYLPSVLWIMALSSMFLIYIESIFAAPLWACAHLATDDEGMGSNTATGYLFTLQLLLRPAMMVAVAICASIVYDGILEIANEGFQSVFQASAGAGVWNTLLSLIGSIAAYLTIAVASAILIFGGVTSVPGKVFSWLGENFGSDTAPTQATSTPNRLLKFDRFGGVRTQ